MGRRNRRLTQPTTIDIVSRLTWVERDHGWRAGPYEIELVAPQLWVCTRRQGRGEATVEMTSGSLSALKTRIERLEARRRCVRRSLYYLAGFGISLMTIAAAVVVSAPLTPVVVVLATSVGIFSALKALDCVLQRSWESLRLDYQ